MQHLNVNYERLLYERLLYRMKGYLNAQLEFS